MTDRELLELAAKAAGVTIVDWSHSPIVAWHPHAEYWNPLTDDGDALRLAVRLDCWPYASSDGRIGVWAIQENGRMRDIYGIDCWHGDGCPRTENHAESKQAATRRAIVRAAAEIGKAMP